MPPKKRATPPGSGVEPSKMKVGDLKEELEKLGLETLGKKADLVSRLEDALKNQGKTLLRSPQGKSSSLDCGGYTTPTVKTGTVQGLLHRRTRCRQCQLIQGVSVTFRR